MPKTATKRFKKKIIKPGVYELPDGTRVPITPERINNWASTHQKMIAAGLHVPAPYFHDEKAVPVRDRQSPTDKDASKNGGFWSRLYVEKDGTLCGEIEAATEDDAKSIGTRVKGVSLLAQPWKEGDVDWGDAITHIALTNKPVAKTDDQFLALSLDAFSSEDYGDLNDPDPDSPGSKSGATLDTALKILATLGMELPTDTTPENLIERIVAAGTAVLSYKKSMGGDSVTQQPKGSRTQPPSPVAMSHELELAVSLLGGANVVDPSTKQPFTIDGLKAAAAAKKNEAHVSLSAEDQALVNFSRDQVRKSYAARLEACVNQGKITPKMAKDLGIPLLENMRVAFAADGQQIPTEIDTILTAWEAIPAGSVLTGNSPTGYERQRVTAKQTPQGFSLDLSGPTVNIEEPPTDYTDPNQPLTDAEADEVLKQTEAMVGPL